MTPGLSPHNARAKRIPGPGKHVKLVAWFLVHKVPVCEPDWQSYIPKACQHAKMPRTAFDAASKRWPRVLEGVARKRARRRAWLRARGSVPQGWTPPDPKDRRTANYPGAALLKRVPLDELCRRLETEFPELFAHGSQDGAEIPDGDPEE